MVGQILHFGRYSTTTCLGLVGLVVVLAYYLRVWAYVRRTHGAAENPPSDSPAEKRCPRRQYLIVGSILTLLFWALSGLAGAGPDWVDLERIAF